MSQIITRSALLSLIGDWRGAGTLVAAPVRHGEAVLFETLTGDDVPVIDATVMPINSIKEFFFPKSEVLYTFKQHGSNVVLRDAEPFATPQVVIAARPCDAAAMPLLDHVFEWDFQDRFYQRRREVTTIVTLACAAADSECFCTSVGCSPETTSGADAVLLPINNDADTFEVRCITEKGTALFAGKTQASTLVGKTATPPAKRFDLEKIQKLLRDKYDHPIFSEEATLRCVGCGACTYLCPTCHCFDMVDEGTSAAGEKRRNWDTCQFPIFTHHASGHNPRSNAAQRQRQRIQHKMVIYPDKFGVLLCTGCGNCRRGCAGSVGVCAVLEALDKLDKQ